MKLHYRKIGEGFPMIIIHGLYGSGDNWLTVGKELGRSLSIYLVDQRNHGLSFHDPEMNYDVLTSDLDEFMIDNRIEKAFIMGHSMGGKVAMNFALLKPEKVEKLVVLDIALRSYLDDTPASSEILMHNSIIDALINLDIEKSRIRSDIEHQLEQKIPQKSVCQFLLKNLKRDEEGKFYWGMNVSSIKKNLLLLLEKIETGGKYYNKPVLVVGGNRSPYLREKDYADFKKTFTDISIVRFDSGHWIHAEQPVLLTETLTRFLC